MGSIRNNVVVSVDCRDREEALHVCRAIAKKHELDGECRNFQSVTLDGGQTALSLRSMVPTATALEIMTMLQSVGVEAFDIATRQKLTEDWTVMRSGKRRRVRLRRDGSRLNLDIKNRWVPRTRLLSI